ncbi:MAG: Gfo/Idh/MocA family oxidoreductase [FCB group bacterium]|jgi:predicted dehydrogenase|nr:Gfo/Idh/MocA family oxidoreductase [FCB group bacterium]
MSTIGRREFLKYSTVATAALASGVSLNASGANERIVVGFMGTGGRGSFLADEFARMEDVEIRWLADPDSRRPPACAANIEKLTGKRPQITQDFRKMLEDPEVDAIVGALPDHWHALGTILACQAGKDMYVEKPASHSIWEGRKMVEAARKYNRVVQVGAQNRSNENIVRAIEYSRTPEFGDIHFVRVLNSKERVDIGKKPDGPVPEGVDYDMWLGPAPKREFNENHFHYAWHWFWNYSGGDIINDGIHQIDVARWLIDRKYPKTVVSGGGINFFKDDQETPDTHTVTWDYDNGLTMCFEQALWAPYMKKTPLEIRDTDGLPNWPFNGTRIEVYGTKQMLFLGRHGDGWQAFNADGVAVAGEPGEFTTSNTKHIRNFLDCIRTRNEPTADIEKLHLSTLLSQYGNIAYRTRRTQHIDAATEGFVDDAEANGLVKRTYREPWVVPETV